MIKNKKLDKRAEALFKKIESAGCSVVEYNGYGKYCIMNCKEHGNFVYVSMKPHLIDDNGDLCPVCKKIRRVNKKLELKGK